MLDTLSWGYPAVGPMRDLTFPSIDDGKEEESIAGASSSGDKREDGQDQAGSTSRTPFEPRTGSASVASAANLCSTETSKAKNHPLLVVDFPVGEKGEKFRDQVEWVPSHRGEYPQPEDFAQELGIDFGLSLEVIGNLAVLIRDQLENPPISGSTSTRRGGLASSTKSSKRYMWEDPPSTRKAPRARQEKKEKVAVYADPENTITRADVTDEMRQKILDKLRADQEPIKIKASKYKNINCHICHNRKEVNYRCCPLNLHNHSYCSNHMRLRWDLTDAMIKEDPWRFSICPPCTLTCPCSACQRKLDREAANHHGFHLRDDMGKIYTAAHPRTTKQATPVTGGPEPGVPTPAAASSKEGSSVAVEVPLPRASTPLPLPKPVPLTDDNDDEDQDDLEEDSDDGLEEEDGNSDLCSVCKRGGGLVCCDSCPRAFHLICLRLSEKDLPEGKWACPRCKEEDQQDFLAAVCPEEESDPDKATLSPVQLCSKLVDFFALHEFASVFLDPIDCEELGLFDYKQIIKKPMDLGTIKTGLDSNHYNSAVGVLTDLRLVWHNCKTYNKEGSAIWRMADHLSRLLERFYETRLKPRLSHTEQEDARVEKEGFEAITQFAVSQAALAAGKRDPMPSGGDGEKKQEEDSARDPSSMPSASKRGWKALYIEAAEAVLSGQLKDLDAAVKAYNLKSMGKFQRVYEECASGDQGSKKGSSNEETLLPHTETGLDSEGDKDASKGKRTKQGKAKPSGKRPKNSETEAAVEATKKRRKTTPKFEIGLRFKKLFQGYGIFVGEIISFQKPYYKVRYEDGDEEELGQRELSRFLKEGAEL